MDNKALYQTLEEVQLQCKFALFAWSELRNSLPALDSEKTFFFVHGLINHSAVVSRICWPKTESPSNRGAHVREALSIENDSKLNNSSLFLQILEPDQSYDDWLETLGPQEFVGMNIMPQGAIAGLGSDIFHRNLDPESMEFVIRGVSCSLKEMRDELLQLERKAQAWLETHNPW
jgi:hypothetical protein